MILFLSGLFLGGCVGMLGMALLVAVRQQDELP